MVSTSGKTVTTTWAEDKENTVIGYRIYYHYGDGSTSDSDVSHSATTHTLTERDGQKVYTVSLQAFSIHLPSSVVGPVTARGNAAVVNTLLVTAPGTVPEPVREIEVAVREERMNISWEATPEPNAFHWNYTVSITDNRTDRVVFSDVVSMNVTHLSIQQLGLGLLPPL